MFLTRRLFVLGLALVLAASPARAGEIDKYLPEDTEVYSVVNIRQILSSGVIKMLGGIDTLKGFVEMSPEATKALKDLGLDPFKDVDRIIRTQPGSGEPDKGLLIVRGKFDLEKFDETAKKAARDNKDVVKVQKIKDGQGGEHTVYEVVLAEAIPNLPAGNLSVYVGLASKDTILAAASKDYLVTGLKAKDNTKARLKNKNFQEMLEKTDDKQSITMVMLAEGLAKGPLDNAPQQVKDIVSKIHSASIGITLTDGIKFDMSVGAKDADGAKTLKEAAENGIDAAKIGLRLLQNPQLDPVIKLLGTVKVSARDKIASVKAEITSEELGKLIPKDQ